MPEPIKTSKQAKAFWMQNRTAIRTYHVYFRPDGGEHRKVRLRKTISAYTAEDAVFQVKTEYSSQYSSILIVSVMPFNANLKDESEWSLGFDQTLEIRKQDEA